MMQYLLFGLVAVGLVESLAWVAATSGPGMKLGLCLVDYRFEGAAARTGAHLKNIAQTVEAAGFDSTVAADHLWLSPWMGGREGDFPLTVLRVTESSLENAYLRLLEQTRG
jgi:hypothetical protein